MAAYYNEFNPKAAHMLRQLTPTPIRLAGSAFYREARGMLGITPKPFQAICSSLMSATLLYVHARAYAPHQARGFPRSIDRREGRLGYVGRISRCFRQEAVSLLFWHGTRPLCEAYAYEMYEPTLRYSLFGKHRSKAIYCAARLLLGNLYRKCGNRVKA